MLLHVSRTGWLNGRTSRVLITPEFVEAIAEIDSLVWEAIRDLDLRRCL